MSRFLIDLQSIEQKAFNIDHDTASWNNSYETGVGTLKFANVEETKSLESGLIMRDASSGAASDFGSDTDCSRRAEAHH